MTAFVRVAAEISANNCRRGTGVNLELLAKPSECESAMVVMGGSYIYLRYLPRDAMKYLFTLILHARHVRMLSDLEAQPCHGSWSWRGFGL